MKTANDFTVTERPIIEYIEYQGVKLANISTIGVFKLERYIDYIEQQNKELRELLERALPCIPAGQLDSDICEILKPEK